MIIISRERESIQNVLNEFWLCILYSQHLAICKTFVWHIFILQIFDFRGEYIVVLFLKRQNVLNHLIKTSHKFFWGFPKLFPINFYFYIISLKRDNITLSPHSRESIYLSTHFYRMELLGLTWLERYEWEKGCQTLRHLWQLCLNPLWLLLCFYYFCEFVSYTFLYNDWAVTPYKILYQMHQSLVVLDPWVLWYQLMY